MSYQQLSASDFIKKLEHIENLVLDHSTFLSVGTATIGLYGTEEETLNIVNLELRTEVVKNYILLNKDNKLSISNHIYVPLTVLIRKLKRHPKIKSVGAENYGTYYKIENANLLCPIVDVEVKIFPSHIPPILYLYIGK